ncbi:MAG: pyridoxamine 5'-phosphate oxidase, partial [Alphaproteobacteria bacterium]|nr:pyridoxamine 5'-phosphate oxidase [Alphaproteobacteria bacterium]
SSDLWLNDAEKTEPNDPTAASLATVAANGQPSVRIILVRGWDEKGFVFYTNFESQKGCELLSHPQAALCFHWKTIRRQIRIEGTAAPVTDEEANNYFNQRPKSHRISAIASSQSRPLESDDVFIEKIKSLEEQYKDSEDVPRPAHWSGFRIVPQKIEFWLDQPSRRHNRLVYCREENGWRTEKLYP